MAFYTFSKSYDADRVVNDFAPLESGEEVEALSTGHDPFGVQQGNDLDDNPFAGIGSNEATSIDYFDAPEPVEMKADDVEVHPYTSDSEVDSQISAPESSDVEALYEIEQIYQSWLDLTDSELQRMFIQKMHANYEQVGSYDEKELIELMLLPETSSNVFRAMRLRLTGSEAARTIATLYFDYLDYKNQSSS